MRSIRILSSSCSPKPNRATDPSSDFALTFGVQKDFSPSSVEMASDTAFGSTAMSTANMISRPIGASSGSGNDI